MEGIIKGKLFRKVKYSVLINDSYKSIIIVILILVLFDIQKRKEILLDYKIHKFLENMNFNPDKPKWNNINRKTECTFNK